MALELTSYDLLPPQFPSFARGFAAALIATVSCYPLDTVRRHIQLQAGRSVAWHVAAGTILREDGVGGLYRGFLPNALKNLPNKGAPFWGGGMGSGGGRQRADTDEENCQAEGCLTVHSRPPSSLHRPLAAGVKLSVFDGAKTLLTTAEGAYDEQCVLAGVVPPMRQEWRPAGRGRQPPPQQQPQQQTQQKKKAPAAKGRK